MPSWALVAAGQAQAEREAAAQAEVGAEAELELHGEAFLVWSEVEAVGVEGDAQAQAEELGLSS